MMKNCGKEKLVPNYLFKNNFENSDKKSLEVKGIIQSSINISEKIKNNFSLEQIIEIHNKLCEEETKQQNQNDKNNM